MQLSQVHLRHSKSAAYIWLRRLSGRDTMLVAGRATRDAIELIQRLIVPDCRGGLEADSCMGLTVTDRDRILLSIFMDQFGSRISTSTRCIAEGCGELFDISVGLSGLAEVLGRKSAAEVVMGDLVARVPTGEDELAVENLPGHEQKKALLARLVVAGSVCGRETALENALEVAAPVAAQQLDLICPECAGAQTASFSLQSYLMDLLAQQNEQLTVDLHLLASSYGWGLDEILDLPISMRRRLASLVENERSAGQELA